MATKIGDDRQRYSATRDLVLKVCNVLQIDEDRLEDLAAEIQRIGKVFAMDRETECFWGAPGVQREAIRRLVRLVEDTLVALHSVSPEYLIALEPMLEAPTPSPGTDDLITRTRASLLDIRAAAVRFDKAYKPTRGAPVDIILEEAVRALTELFTANGFGKPEVTPGRAEQPPKLRNKEAQAIAELVWGIDPRTEIRSIVNMIVAVEGGRRASEPHLYGIWKAIPYFGWDISLHPRRGRRT